MKSSAKKSEGQSKEQAKGPARAVTLKTIQQAAKRIRSSIYLSPFMRSETFSQLTGNSLFLKLENLQMTGSFKERGALNKILLLTPDERRRRGQSRASRRLSRHQTRHRFANRDAAHHSAGESFRHARPRRRGNSLRRELRRSLPGSLAPLRRTIPHFHPSLR